MYYPDPSAGRETDTPPEEVRSRHVPTGAGTWVNSTVFSGKARPPTAFNAVNISALCCGRARGDFCQTVLLTARYQGAQCSR